MTDVSFCVECENETELSELIRTCAEAVMRHEDFFGGVNITIVSEDEIRRINRDFRGIDRVTDVLSFPAWDGNDEVADGFLGDIAICLKRAKEQATEYGHSLRREIGFLTVHGMLHILGYDHMTPEDERVMFPLQEEVLEGLGIRN